MKGENNVWLQERERRVRTKSLPYVGYKYKLNILQL